jgi:predicted O-methyltransferase YrrM
MLSNTEVKRRVGATPVMSPEQAERLTWLIAEHGVRDILELGFSHGVSTCYMAAALGRGHGGHIVTIDREVARTRQPNIEELLARIGERERVTVYFEPTSYTWRLMKFLEETPPPQFDLCYIDGAHSWFVDGFAFFLVDLLLKPGGWIVFDDLYWTYATSPSLVQSKLVKEMPEDERTTPQVHKIYELLVKPHPSYHNFRIEANWAYAQKRTDVTGRSPSREIVVEKVIEERYVGLGGVLVRAAKRLGL